MGDVSEQNPQQSPASPSTTSHNTEWVSEVERQFRERDSGAFFVLPRVVRRVLQSELEIHSPLLPPAHRKSCVIERDKLLWLVARDELGVDSDTPLPQRLILIARPDEDRLGKFSREQLLRYYWRLLFHARIDFEMQPKTSASRMATSELRSRIDGIGQTQFDEIRSVLRTEQMLLKPDDPRQVYSEFVAVWHELRSFAPDLLPLYFPSIDDEESILRTIGSDCDASSILEATRPAELPVNGMVPSPTVPASVAESLLEGSQIHLATRSPRKYASLARQANKFRIDGNNVRAALVRRQAFDIAPLDKMPEARTELLREIEFLVLRLQAALELSDDEVRPWLAMCERLLPAARRGFWNANARLLYDLQQVCLDHEQEIYKVDLLRWMKTLGKESLKRPLPYQRVVMMSKHLRIASSRVSTVEIDAGGRRELSSLIHAAASAADLILRKRMEPLIAESMTDAGLVPNGVVERVAFRKGTQELLDGVAQRGFLTLGDIRDAIARNPVKMPDLVDTKEFFQGDPLLRADILLASRIDGVYQRGPFYLRWMQRMNSLAYGTHYGRLLTKFVFLPFGLAFLLLMAMEEVAHLLVGHPHEPAVASAPHESSHGESRTENASESDPRSKSTSIGGATGSQKTGDVEDGNKEQTSSGSNDQNLIKAEEPKDEDVTPSVEQGTSKEAIDEIETDQISNASTDEDNHLIHSASHSPSHGHPAPRHFLVYSNLNMFLVGCVIFALIHSPAFRNRVLSVLKATWKLTKILFVELPIRIVKFPLVAWLLKSFPFRLFRQFVLGPLIATVFFCFILPLFGVYDRPGRWWTLTTLLASSLAMNSRIGRDTEELTREFLVRTWYRIRTHLLLGLLTLIIDAFHWLMDALERVLYAVDEWLRFRSGESSVVLGVKAVLGLIWSFVHGVIRFCMTLLIEPQINPIKHFPVVTVSHKLVLTTLTIPLATILQKLGYDQASAYSMTFLILSGIPGVFGFIAWELKENWKLYVANRTPSLRPVRIGHHGESLLRLLTPGFHSGTIPKLFARRRRATRKAHHNPNVNKQARYAEKLHHEEESLRHFFERELVGLLQESRTFRGRPLVVEHIELATNRVTLHLKDASDRDDPARIEFAEQSGWLVGTVAHQGWLADLTDEDRAVFRTALAGLYKMASVELVREQIESHLQTVPLRTRLSPLNDLPANSNTDESSPSGLGKLSHHPYDIASAGLIVWPQGHYEAEVTYSLDEAPLSTPRPRSLARAAGLNPMPISAIRFTEHEVNWSDWRAYWETEQNLSAIPLRLLPEVELLRRP